MSNQQLVLVENAIEGILLELHSVNNAVDLEKLKLKWCKKFDLADVIRSSELLSRINASTLYSPEEKIKFKKLLKTNPVRENSGVSVIAIMAMPAFCPHGTCVYCPGGPGTNSPQSYTGFEPAARRAAQNGFDAGKQVRSRLKQFNDTGHTPEKCEVIIMGGTFNSFPRDYQYSFVKSMYEGFNGVHFDDLNQAKLFNETAEHRIIGLTFETRPTCASQQEISDLLDFGCTRIEFGVQVLDDKIYMKAKRGHTLQDVVDATWNSKRSFLKVCYHMMPGLFSTPEQDIGYFKTLFSDERFQPDMIKIYPTLVLPGTGLYDLWKRGLYKPYDAEQASEVISEAMRYVPEYCRVMRVDRDIPTTLIVDGVKKSNLRELVMEKMKEKNIRSREIRGREVGIAENLKKASKPGKIELIRREYNASKGKEVFLSFEDVDNDLIIGFCRLRSPGDSFRQELTETISGLRELHVYGRQDKIGGLSTMTQHKSYGKQLMIEAERISKEEWNCDKIAVISGIGVKEYYKKIGYAHDGVYMSKKL